MSSERAIKICAALAIGAAALAARPAHSEWYVSVQGGASFLMDADASDRFTGGSAEGTAESDIGYVLTGALGHAWGPFRLEGELSYRKNDLDKLDVSAITLAGIGTFRNLGTFALDGDVTSLGFMANAYYDFNTGTPWVPFIGAGIGGARLNLDIKRVGTVATRFDESDTVFAYQVGAGIGYKFTPNIMATLSYRFFGTSDPEFNVDGETIDSEYRSHSVMAGVMIRW